MNPLTPNESDRSTPTPPKAGRAASWRPWTAGDIRYLARDSGWPAVLVDGERIEGEAAWLAALERADAGMLAALHRALGGDPGEPSGDDGPDQDDDRAEYAGQVRDRGEAPAGAALLIGTPHAKAFLDRLVPELRRDLGDDRPHVVVALAPGESGAAFALSGAHLPGLRHPVLFSVVKLAAPLESAENRLSVAHELAHHRLGHSTQSPSERGGEAERAARERAAEALARRTLRIDDDAAGPVEDTAVEPNEDGSCPEGYTLSEVDGKCRPVAPKGEEATP